MKRVRPGTVTLGVFAVLVGLVAAYAARQYLQKPARLVAAPKAAPVMGTIVVPRVNLPQYVRVEEAYIEERQVPAAEVPADAIRSKNVALFRLVKSTVMAGQTLREQDLYAVSQGPTLAEQLGPDERAVTVQVTAESAVDGMIQPGAHVDINITAASEIPANCPSGDCAPKGAVACFTLLEDMRVLATSEARFPKAQERAVEEFRSLTLAATPEQANKLTLARRLGNLSVTLRASAQDALASNLNKVSPADILGLAPEPQIEPVPEPLRKVATVWRGGMREEIVFGESEILESEQATLVMDGKDPKSAVPVRTQPQQPTPAPPRREPLTADPVSQPTATQGVLGTVVDVQVSAEAAP